MRGWTSRFVNSQFNSRKAFKYNGKYSLTVGGLLSGPLFSDVWWDNLLTKSGVYHNLPLANPPTVDNAPLIIFVCSFIQLH